MTYLFYFTVAVLSIILIWEYVDIYKKLKNFNKPKKSSGKRVHLDENVLNKTIWNSVNKAVRDFNEF